MINVIINTISYLFSLILSPTRNFQTTQWFNKFRTSWLKNFMSIGNGTIIKSSFVVGCKHIVIGDFCIIGRRTILATYPLNVENKEALISIESRTEIGDDSNISASARIYIGEGVLTGRKVMINNTSHGSITIEQLKIPPRDRPILSTGEIIIEKNVWIGEMAIILGGVHIGEGAIVAAGAIVTKDIPAFSVSAGCPARVIKIL